MEARHVNQQRSSNAVEPRAPSVIQSDRQTGVVPLKPLTAPGVCSLVNPLGRSFRAWLAFDSINGLVSNEWLLIDFFVRNERYKYYKCKSNYHGG